MKTKLEKDIETTIKVLRFMTGGQGYAAISVFDAGAGGGFSEGSVTVNLERDGLIFPKNASYTPEELKEVILQACNAWKSTPEEVEERYSSKSRNRKWND